MSQPQTPREPPNGPPSIPRKPVPRRADQPSSRPRPHPRTRTPSPTPSPPRALEKRPSFLQRAATAARKVIPSKADTNTKKNDENNNPTKTPSKLARKLADALPLLSHERSASTLIPLAHPQILRSRALSRATALDATELNTLAAAEEVYIGPGRRGSGGDPYDRQHEEALLHGLVARLSKKKSKSKSDRGGAENEDENENENEADASYIFLGADRALYRGSHDRGLDARRIDPGEEAPEYTEVRQLSRAYYQLCL